MDIQFNICLYKSDLNPAKTKVNSRCIYRSCPYRVVNTRHCFQQLCADSVSLSVDNFKRQVQVNLKLMVCFGVGPLLGLVISAAVVSDRCCSVRHEGFSPKPCSHDWSIWQIRQSLCIAQVSTWITFM